MLKGLRAIFDKRMVAQSPYEFLPSSETIERLQTAQLPARSPSTEKKDEPKEPLAPPTSVLPSPLPQPVMPQKRELVFWSAEEKTERSNHVELVRVEASLTENKPTNLRALEGRALQAQATRNAVFVTPRISIPKEDLNRAIALVEAHIAHLRDGSVRCLRSPERKIQAFVELLVKLKQPDPIDFSVADIVRRWERGLLIKREHFSMSILDVHRNRFFSEVRPTVSTQSRTLIETLRTTYDSETRPKGPTVRA